MIKCFGCDKEILDGEDVYQLMLGSIETCDMFGRPFVEAISCPNHGYIHDRCYFDNYLVKPASGKNKKEGDE